MTDRTRIWIRFKGEKMTPMEEARALLISGQSLGKEVQAVYWVVYELESWANISLSPKNELEFEEVQIDKKEEFLRMSTNIAAKEWAKYKVVEGVKVTKSPQGILLIEILPLSAEGELDFPSDGAEGFMPTEDPPPIAN